MASENNNTKAATAPKTEVAPKLKSTPAEDVSKGKDVDKAAAPSSYSRGEGQKPVTPAYKENWNAIFAKKKSKKKQR